ncbi:MAG: carbohydrate-binding family 9-like protein, partial [Gemmatimonadales bacterium]|nr:carbohydrate-binding family 9-like protein [Gemmatimonadales bacterium]
MCIPPRTDALPVIRAAGRATFLLHAAVVLAWLALSPAAAQPPPREYEALAAASPPVIDGSLDDAVWRAAPWTESFVDIRGEGWPEPHLGTRAKIVWDERFLYVGGELEEPHLWATLADRDAILYREHDFEVFLDPDGDGLAYYELEINALGTEFDLF